MAWEKRSLYYSQSGLGIRSSVFRSNRPFFVIERSILKKIESIPSIFKNDRRSTGAIRSFGLKRGKTYMKKYFFLLNRSFFVIERLIPSLKRSTRSCRYFSKIYGSRSISSIFKKYRRLTRAIWSFGKQRGETVKNIRKIHFFSRSDQSFFEIERSIRSRWPF